MTVQKASAIAQHAISSAMALVSPQAAERSVEIKNQCATEPHVGYCGDEDRVRQILVNLLSNAVKFTHAGGSVALSCGTTSGPNVEAILTGPGPWAFVSVEDTGVGIAEDTLESVFQAFVQVESGHTRRVGGTGLGLTISRELARLMGGDLTVQSQVGQGSCFTLWLPVPDTSDDTMPLQQRSTLPRREAMIAVGRAVLQEAQSIMTRFGERLCGDPHFPGSADLSNADLQDHGVAFLSDIAQSLVAWEESDAEPLALLRDGGEIQRVISDLHGTQRVRLGWGEEQIHREFEILRDEVERAVRRKVQAFSEEELADALGVLMRCLKSAERISCRAVRQVS